MTLETRPVTYHRSPAEVPEAPFELADVVCEPDLRQGPRHRLLVPVHWQPILELPVDPDLEALRICSLFLETPAQGERGAVLMVASASGEDAEALIRGLAASEGQEVEEIHQERPGDLRALCASASRASMIRVLRHEKDWLVLTATAPADRFEEVQDAFHFALTSLEPG